MIETTIIGEQEWMVKNLNTTRFRNGEYLFHARTKEEWYKAFNEKTPAYCIYQGKMEIFEKHGYLYNFHAVSDPRGLAPDYWNIPSVQDCKELLESLDGPYRAGRKMKYTEGWFQEGNGDNKSGWSARPGGSRDFLGNFKYFQDSGYWWTKDDRNVVQRWAEYFSLNWSDSIVYFGTGDKADGHYVRCFR